jgi:hypothetical protein
VRNPHSGIVPTHIGHPNRTAGANCSDWRKPKRRDAIESPSSDLSTVHVRIKVFFAVTIATIRR